jgi:hypothetical protein
MNTLHFNLRRLGTSRHASAVLLISVALAWSSPAFCGPIHEAARDGDAKKVEALLKEQPSLVSSKDEQSGQTPLHIAAFNDRIDVAKLLLANNADINAKAKNGSTPLHLAAAKGNKDMVEFLLSNKADVNAVDNDGWTPMHSAIFWEHDDVADLLGKDGGKDLPAPRTPPPATAAKPAEKATPKETGTDGQLVAFDNGTVADTKTNLMWSSRDNGVALNWPAAKAYAASYRGGGYSDWRLPTLEELAALYKKDKTRKTNCAAAVDEIGQAADEVHLSELIHLSCTRVWTSQVRADKPGSVTIYDFHSGTDAARPEAASFTDTASRVLLVRNAKP